jgi:hypothetical protein
MATKNDANLKLVAPVPAKGAVPQAKPVVAAVKPVPARPAPAGLQSKPVAAAVKPAPARPATAGLPSKPAAASRPAEHVAASMSPKASPGPAEPLEARIARRAYELYVGRGRQHGRDLEDWFRAAAEVTGAQQHPS